MKPLQEFTAEIEALDLEGRGVAHRDGKVAFIEGALPGEQVRYQRLRSKPRYETGRAIEIAHPSWQRVTPRCPYFGIHDGACGGCSMQHLSPQSQVAAKQRVLEDALWHLGKIRPERMLRPIAGPAWNYRHRARMSARYVEKKGGALIGFREHSSSYVVDMLSCDILPVHVSNLLPPLRQLVGALSIREQMPQIELAVAQVKSVWVTVLVFRTLQEPSADDLALLAAFEPAHNVDIWLQPKGPDTARPLRAERACALALELPEFQVSIPFFPTEFTQVNHSLNAVLVSQAVRLLAPQRSEVVADFFCGLGNFSLPLATLAAKVIGIEGSAPLVQRAEAAAKAHRLSGVADFAVKNLFDWTVDDWQALVRQHGSIDKVLIDPPREGAMALAQTLAAGPQRPQRVVYVSCNPGTLARDCAIMVHEGGWQLRAAGIVNMFPHTSHVESMAVLEPG